MENLNNVISIFENTQFGSIRSIVLNDEPMFIGKDVAACLGYVDIRQAVMVQVDKEDRITKSYSQLKGILTNVLDTRDSDNQSLKEFYNGTTLINESGVYSLIFGSTLDSAKAFRRWVTKEVLPAIRRNGAYISETITEEQDQYRHEKAVIEMIRLKKRIGKRLMSIWKNFTPHQIKMSAMYILDNLPAGAKKQGVFEAITGATKQLERDYRDPAKNSEYDPNVSVQFRSDLFYPLTEELVKFNNRSHGQTIRHIEGKVAQKANNGTDKKEDGIESVPVWSEKCRCFVPVKLSTKSTAPDRKVSFGVNKLYLHFSLYARPDQTPVMRVSMGGDYQRIGEIREQSDILEVGGMRLQYDFITHEAVVLVKR